MIKLKAKDVPVVRAELLEQQGGTCPLCNTRPVIPCLDHAHPAGGQQRGWIRGVLCSGHNMMLGKIENNSARYGIPIDDLPTFLRLCATYLDTHKEAVHQMLHPTSRSPEEKKELARKRRQRKRNANV